MADRVRKQVKRRGREPRDSVGSTPTPVTVTGPVVQWEGICVTCRKRWFNSIRDHLAKWSVGVSAARRHGKAEDRVQFPDGPLELGLHAVGGD